MSGAEVKGVMRECVVARSATQMDAFRFPCRIDAFIFGIGTEGETSVSFNMQEHRLAKNSMFFFGPKSTLHINSNDSFKANVVVVSADLMRGITIDTKHLMPVMLKFGSFPCLSVTSEDCQTLRNFISLIEQETRVSETQFTTDILGGLISALVYRIADILQRYLVTHPEVENPAHNRAEEYFKQFLMLLGQHYKEERSVGFYAQRLCITPKYLTTIIKRISGKSVSTWVDHFVIMEAKTMLKYSHMSVQEIAYDLNFPNQSFFGSYFKRNTGMSPSQYKMQN